MKTVKLLLCSAMLCATTFAQTITDPSSNPGYDAAKSSSLRAAGINDPIIAARSASTQKTSDAQRQTSSACWIPTDNSYVNFPGNDDGSVGPFPLAFSFNLYGTNYNQVWINNNGNLTFTGAYSPYTPTGFPFDVPMVAAFWGDVDTRSGLGTVDYKINPTNVIVTYTNVGYYNVQGNYRNTFQIIITDGNDPIIGIGNNVAFHYLDMQWTTGQVSGSTTGFGGSPATVGVNQGNSIDYVQVGRFGLDNEDYDGGGGNTDGVHYLDNECFNFNVSNVQNQPPSYSGAPTNNTVNVDCGSTETFTISFLPPEVGQQVSVAIDAGGLCGVTTAVTSGAVATATISIAEMACNVGTHVISITGTDNYPTPASTTVEITVNVATCCPAMTCNASSPKAASCGDYNITCNGGTGSAAVTVIGGCGPYTYAWSNSETGSSISGITAGTYDVTVTSITGATTSCSVTLTQPAALTATASSTNPLIFYGYTLDQKAPISVTSTGGCGAKTYSWSMSRGLLCNVVNSAGDESLLDGWNVNCSCAATSCSTPVGTYSGTSFSAMLTSDANFTAVVTDANGCTASGTVHIDAIDARCFAGNSGNQKVQMCHHTGSASNPYVTLCIAQSAVPEMLAQGDCLGACNAYSNPMLCSGYRMSSDLTADGQVFNAYPNPFNHTTTIAFTVPADEHALVRVFDALGRQVAVLFDGEAKAGTEYQVDFNGAEYSEGVYFYNIVSGTMNETGKMQLMK